MSNAFPIEYTPAKSGNAFPSTTGGKKGYVKVFSSGLASAADQSPAGGKLTIGGVDFATENENAGSPKISGNKLIIEAGATTAIDHTARTGTILTADMTDFYADWTVDTDTVIQIKLTPMGTNDIQMALFGLESSAYPTGASLDEASHAVICGFASGAGKRNLKLYTNFGYSGTAPAYNPANQTLEMQYVGTATRSRVDAIWDVPNSGSLFNTTWMARSQLPAGAISYHTDATVRLIIGASSSGATPPAAAIDDFSVWMRV